MRNNKNIDNDTTIGERLAIMLGAIPKMNEEGGIDFINVDPLNLIDSVEEIVGNEPVKLKQRKLLAPEMVEVTDPNGKTWNVPIFNKTGTNQVDRVTGLTIRQVKLPAYVGHIENGRFELAIQSLYIEMAFQLRNALNLNLKGIYAPVAVSAEIPVGHFKFLYDSQNRVSRVLVNEAEMRNQAVDADGDMCLAFLSPDGKKIVFCKIPFTSQAPILRKFEGQVWESFNNLTLKDLKERFTQSVSPTFYKDGTAPEEVPEGYGQVMSLYDQFIKNHTIPQVGLTTMEWNALEAMYFDGGYEEGCRLAFATMVTVDGESINGRYNDIEKGGLKLSRKDGLTAQTHCYNNFKYPVYSGVAKCLMSSASGIAKLKRPQLQHLRYSSLEELINRYWYMNLSKVADAWDQVDLEPKKITITEKAIAMVKEQGYERAFVSAKNQVKNSVYGWTLLREVCAIGNKQELVDLCNQRIKDCLNTERESGWKTFDSGLIARLVRNKRLKFTEVAKHLSGHPVYQVELTTEDGKSVALMDQKRDNNELPDKGIGFFYLLVPTFDAKLGVWLDGKTAMMNAFKQEYRYVKVVDPDGEETEVLEKRSFDRYNFIVMNPETGAMVRGFGNNPKDFKNKTVMVQLQEAISAYCGKTGILVHSTIDRQNIAEHNLNAAKCIATVIYGRYEQSPEDMWEIFAKASIGLKLCPGNKQSNPCIRKYVVAQSNGNAVWASKWAHMSRPGKALGQIPKTLLRNKFRVAIVDTTTYEGGWASTQGVEAQNNVQCFYPRVIQDPELAAQYAEDHGIEFDSMETKTVTNWCGEEKQIWLTKAKDQIEAGKMVDCKYGLKFMSMQLGGEVVDENGNDIHFVLPVTEVIAKGALNAFLQEGMKETVISITEKQDGKSRKTRVKALVIDLVLFRSGSHGENMQPQVKWTSIAGFDRFALIQSLKEVGFEIPEPRMDNFELTRNFLNELEAVNANS